MSEKKVHPVNKQNNDVPEIPGSVPSDQLPAQPESIQPITDPAQPGNTTPAQPDPQPAPPEAESNTGQPGPNPRTLANRENAKKSTGPRTRDGKAASSQNALKHGLFCQDISKFFKGEELERYLEFVDGYADGLHPVGIPESIQARRAADCQYRLQMLFAAEMLVYSGEAIPLHCLAIHIANSKDPPATASQYESRIQRDFKLTMDEFRKLQQARKDDEKQAYDEMKDVVLAHINQNATIDPADYGFVISGELLFNKVRLSWAKVIASNSVGNAYGEKKVVDYLARRPEKAA